MIHHWRQSFCRSINVGGASCKFKENIKKKLFGIRESQKLWKHIIWGNWQNPDICACFQHILVFFPWFCYISIVHILSNSAIALNINKEVLKNINIDINIDKDLSYRTPQAQANPIWDLFEVFFIQICISSHFNIMYTWNYSKCNMQQSGRDDSLN